MKNIFYLSIISLITAISAHAATPWWEQPTICRINPTNCYSNMTVGYLIDIGNPETWDNTNNCWGLKVICPNALTTGANAPVPMEKALIESRKNIKSDFDTDALSKYDECFGIRKSNADGSKVSVNGEYVNVWCNDVLGANKDTVIEDTENGQVIISGTQPTCNSLGRNGYVAIKNDQDSCYGKYYDTSEYFIDCGIKPTPDRLIVLNGADYIESGSASVLTPDSADKLFEQMFKISEEQRSKYTQ